MGIGPRAVADVGVGVTPGEVDPGFWAGRRVLVSGHTGFKGAWLVLWLARMGARVAGLSEAVPTQPSLYELAGVAGELTGETWADVRDHAAVAGALGDHAPEVVVHMAAQPLVRRSFAAPRETYEINVMGTVNVLEAVRASDSVRAVVVVTSDKCYDNREQRRAFVEDDCMGGHDPYSNSKGCAELVADAYLRSFFAPSPGGPRLATGRAGNVIGGGDWGEDRLVPDMMRGAVAGEPVRIRSPEAVRPWQHVLNPLSGYLLLAQRIWEDPTAQGGWNFGPAAGDVRPVRGIADRVSALWPGEITWEIDPGPHPHEAAHLALDSTRARERLGWAPRWDLEQALESIVTWHAAQRDGADLREVTLDQIAAFAGQ